MNILKEEIIKQKIDHLKPKMKTLKSITDVEFVSETIVVQVKADGEFSYIHYSRNGETYVLNRFGRKRWDFPALNELVIAMQDTDVESAEFLAELYAEENGKPLSLPQFIHYVKSHNSILINKVHIGIWDLLSVNNQPLTTLRHERYKLVQSWLENLQLVKRNPLVHVLPYITPKSKAEIEQFWNEMVVQKGWEGLVIRIGNNEIFKVKPRLEADFCVVAINKTSSYGKPNLYREKQVTSIKLALMKPDGKFVVVGDCASGIDVQLRKALWQLVENFKVAEDEKCVWIKPFLIATVEYTDLYPNKNRVYSYTEQNGYVYTEEINLARLRHPRLLNFRKDKRVCPNDLRLEQLPVNRRLQNEVYGKT